MTIHIKTNFDAGAPVLSSTAGAMVAVLDWFLVTTLGWTKPFSNSTTGAVFRPAAGNRHFYQFTNTLTYQTEVRSFSAMTAWNTGTNGTTAAMVHFPNWSATTADTTPVDYTLISDGTFVLMFVYQGAGTGQTVLCAFGDVISYLPGDAYASLISGPSGYSQPTMGHVCDTGAVPNRTMVRASDQITSQKSIAFVTTAALLQGYLGAGDILYPNEVTGGIVLFPVLLCEQSPVVIRGRIPGILSPARSSTLLPGTTFNGTGDLAGRTYKVFAVGPGSAGASTGRVAVETSDTWRT